MPRAVLPCAPGMSFGKLIAVCLFLLTISATSGAVDAGQELSELNHTVFSSLDNSPGNVTAIGQTRDGYLWIGTSVGLFAFDGARFTRPRLDSPQDKLNGDISTIFVDKNDDLWVGIRLGGIYRYSRGRLTHFNTAAGLPARTVTGIVRDTNGALVASTLGGLYTLTGLRWTEVLPGRGENAVGSGLRSVVLDGQGTVWTAGDRGVFCRPRGAAAFVEGRAGKPPGHLFLDGQRQAWYSDQAGLLALSGAARRITGKDIPAYGNSTREFVIELVDRAGSAWGMLGNEFVRFEHADRWLSDSTPHGLPPPQFLLREQRMSGDVSRHVFEDREGNVWVGTNGGLDRFRSTKFSHVTVAGERLPEAALAATSDGAIWIGTDTQGLVRSVHGKVERTGILFGDGPHNGVLSLYAQADGTLWVGGRSELRRYAAGRLETIPLPFGEPASTIQAISTDSGGALWLSVIGRGILKRSNGAWASLGSPDGLPDLEALSLHGDAEGRMWIGYQDNRIVVVQGRSIRTIGPEAGLSVGNALAMLPQDGRMWVAGTNGLGVIENGRYWPLVGKASASVEGVSGIVRSATGDLWINAAGGVRRMPASTIAAFLADHSRTVEWEPFNFQDGIIGMPATLNPIPTAVASSDGRLWFSTTNGLFSVDPSRMARNPAAPHVLVEGVAAQGRAFLRDDQITLPRRTNELRIDYTATALAIPERVRFKYRLEPVQNEWQEAVGRRQAYYTNLRPGIYRFSVVAANEDGVWSAKGDSIEIRIPPAFWETPWFKVACVLAGALGLWSAYVLRLKVIAGRIATRMEDLARERERIARDLHDTLLQGTQGLVLNFQGIANSLPRNDANKQRMQAVLDRADDILDDARNCVQWLRNSDEAPADLRVALIDVGNQLSSTSGMGFELKQAGDPVVLDADVQEELRRIATEALSNAFRHSAGRAVSLELRYEGNAFLLTVKDDGTGLDAATMKAGYRTGHWGLVGMRERAQRIGAHIELQTSGSGTTVNIRVPANQIYMDEKRFGWARRRAFGSARARREKNVV